jgi:hypothetical protein
LFLPWDCAFRVNLSERGLSATLLTFKKQHTDSLASEEMFPDHDSVDRSWVFECEECKSARLAIRIPDDRTCVDHFASRQVKPEEKTKSHATADSSEKSANVD